MPSLPVDVTFAIASATAVDFLRVARHNSYFNLFKSNSNHNFYLFIKFKYNKKLLRCFLAVATIHFSITNMYSLFLFPFSVFPSPGVFGVPSSSPPAASL